MMGNLLGDRIDEITPLEGAILIMSAYLHDAGMVFKPIDIDRIADEDNFQSFLQKFPTAAVMKNAALRENPAAPIPEDVIEWYCRWSHPTRIAHAIFAMELDLLWEGNSIASQITQVGESHGRDVRTLRDLEPSYRAEADLIFCAVLLRLADILDFDNTRSPDVIYRYLNLPEIGRLDSDKEWRKHYASGGFKIQGDQLYFTATPDKPAIEFDIRGFLNTIERELGESRIILQRNASEKWCTLNIPTEIVPQITSLGYKYGEHRFTLEQNQILNLFMGEKLYANQYVFIRELIQNAIDTTRHRIIYEQAHGKPDYQPLPITLTTWIDRDGYQWVRIDDYGMGMEEHHIVNYLLRVGNSYYRSNEFAAELGLYETHKGQTIDFMPISRFGIGLLSCFIVAAQLEISTRRAPKSKFSGEKLPALRLSMDGLQSFYTVCVSNTHEKPAIMPNSKAEDEDYRRGENYGTSVAVRLDPRIDHSEFDLVKIVQQHVMTSSVPIEVDGERIGDDYNKVIIQPWLPKRLEFELVKDEYEQIEQIIGIEFQVPPKVIIQPLDFTKYSLNKDLQGQGVICYLDFNERELWKRDKQEINISIGVDFKYYSETEPRRGNDLPSVHKSRSKDPFILNVLFLERVEVLKDTNDIYFDDSDYQFSNNTLYNFVPHELHIPLSRISVSELPKLLIDGRQLCETYISNDDSQFQGLSHNGVNVPYDKLGILTNVTNGWISFHIALHDSLRPDISLSRDQIQSIPWFLYSSLMLTLYRVLPVDIRLISSPVSFYVKNSRVPDLRLLLGDKLITEQDAWYQEVLFETNRGPRSMAQIHKEFKDGLDIKIELPSRSGPFGVLRSALLQIYLDFELISNYTLGWPQTALCKITSLKLPHQTVDRNIINSIPLTFVPYYNYEGILALPRSPINRKHPFAQWFLANTLELHERYPGLLEQLRLLLTGPDTDYTFDQKWPPCEHINAILRRLQQLKYHNALPESKFLSDDDFDYKKYHKT